MRNLIREWIIYRQIRKLHDLKLERMEQYLLAEEADAPHDALVHMDMARRYAKRIEKLTGEPELLWRYA
jgi:hypothetical protein